MTIVYDADVAVTMRTVADPVGLPYTVNSVELAGREMLVEIREGPPGIEGPQGDPAWPWLWMGDIASFAALQALGLGTSEARRAWRVVDENALYLWSGMEFIRFADAFQAPGHKAAPTALVGDAVAGATGSSASATITGTAPNQTLSITFPRGATGVVGDPGTAGRIADAQDVDVTAARQDYVLSWDAVDNKFHTAPPPRLAGPWAIAGNQFAGGSNLSQSPKTLATMNIPSLPYPWRPVVIGGTIGLQNHVSTLDSGRVNIEIRLGSVDGILVGYGVSVSLANNSEVAFHPRWEYPISPASDLGIVAANTTAALYVIAKRVSGNSNYSIQTAAAQLIVMAQPYNP